MKILVNIFLTLPVLLLSAAIVMRWLRSCGVPLPVLRRNKKECSVTQEDSPCKCADIKMPAGKTDMKKQLCMVFLWAIFIRVLLYLVAWMLANFSAPTPFENIFSLFCQWDANAYLRIIHHGYGFYEEGGQHLDLVFFPLFPWLVRPFAWLLGNALAAGCMVSTLCFAGGCCWLYRLSAYLHGTKAARYAVLFASVFPFSFFFGSTMTEGLFFLTTTAALYFAVRHKWIWFAVWGILAAATRMTGVLVMIPAFMELMQSHFPMQREKPIAKQIKGLLGRFAILLLPLLGTGTYLLVNYMVEGNPFIFLKYQTHWSQGSMWFSNVLQYVFDYLMRNLTTDQGFAIWYPTLLLFPLVFALLVAAWKKGNAATSLMAYGIVYLVANYSLSWLLSAGRYLSCGCVFFLFAGNLMENRPILRRAVLVVSSIFLVLYLNAYIFSRSVM